MRSAFVLLMLGEVKMGTVTRVVSTRQSLQHPALIHTIKDKIKWYVYS